MFPVKARAVLPVERIVIHSVAVRGQLGQMTVWVSNEDVVGSGNGGNHYTFRLNQRRWTKVYEKFHAPSRRKYDILDLSSNPIVLAPGQVRAIYIHSTLPGDEAIVYDNSHFGTLPRRNAHVRYEDDCISIYSGKAHLSCSPFGQTPIWGWGNAWRDRREFVGQINYGTVYKLWSPERHLCFGSKFCKATHAMLLCQRRYESPVSMLPDECIYYILNMCRWDWFEDRGNQMKVEQRARRKKIRQEVERIALKEVGEQVNAALGNNNTDDTPMRVNAATQQTRNMSSNGESEDEDDDDYRAEDSIDADDVDDEDQDEENEEELDDEDDDDHSMDSNDDDDEVHGYRADTLAFRHQDISSDEEDNDNDADNTTMDRDDYTGRMTTRQSWFRTQFHRVHILRALSHHSGA